MKQSFLLLLLFLLAVTMHGSEPGLLFHADFDSYNVTADFAKGNPKSLNFRNPDLQLRMFPGIKGKGNALKLQNEYCGWHLPGNINPSQGTVSLWVSPQNWKVSKKNYQIFFEARQKKFRLLIYKYANPAYLAVFLAADGRQGVVYAKVKDSDWTAGSWHHLTAVWNSTELRLFVDGRLPVPFSAPGFHPAVPQMKFSPPLSFPEPAVNGFVVLGKNNGFPTDSKDATAFDELRIHDRCRTAQEIAREYERYFPSDFGQTLQPPVLTIPKTAGCPRIDGVLQANEWKNAAMIPLLRAYKTENHLARSQSWLRLKTDRSYLYLGFSTDLKNTRHKFRKNDEDIYNDDIFEFFMEDTAGQELWFSINGNGAVFDARNSNRKWDSGARGAAVIETPAGWTAEMAIPLSALGNPQPGNSLAANFWTLNFARLPNCYWSWHGSPADRLGKGRVIFAGNDEGIAIRDTGNIFNGQLNLKITGRHSGPVQAFIENLERRITFDGDILNQTWSTRLPAGKQRLLIKADNAAGKADFLYELFYTVNNPLELTFQAFPLKNKIDVKIDLNNAGNDILGSLGQLQGQLELIDNNGRIYAKTRFTPKTITVCPLPLPSGLASGTYFIKASIFGGGRTLHHQVPFRIPDRTPYLEKTADDHLVPDPWHAIKVKGNSCLILDREYRFNGSPFPSQMISREAPLLTNQPVLTLDGTPVQWQNFRCRKKYDDCIHFQGRGVLPGFTFDWKSELWFDGLYRLDFSMLPDGKRQIRSMQLDWRIPAEHGRYFMQHNKEYVTIPWNNNCIRTKLNIRQSSWLTGIEKGMLWLPLSEANWIAPPDNLPFILQRNEKNIHVTLKIIGRPAELDTKADFSIAFMATPAKRPPKNFRSFNLGSSLRNRCQTAQTCGWGGFYNVARPDDMIALSHIMRDPEAFREKSIVPFGRKNVKLFPYAQPGSISEYDAEFDYWLPTWVRTPGHTEQLTKLGVKTNSRLCCGSGVADLMAYRVDRLFTDFPELGGIYYDICNVTTCSNPEHGCGGIDAFGRKYTSSTAMHLRHYLMRIYKVAHRHGKQVFNHAHNYFNPVAHNFTDIWYPGENEGWLYGMNPDHYYCEAPLDEYQCAWNPFIRGTAIVRCSQVTRVLVHIKRLASRKKELSSPEISERSLAPVLLHDFNSDSDWINHIPVGRWWQIKAGLDFDKAQFHGYWFSDAVRSTSDKVYASWYRLSDKAPFSHLIIAANLGRTPKAAGLIIDHEKMDLQSEGVKFHELWTNQSFSAEKLSSHIISGNHFIILGISSK